MYLWMRCTGLLLTLSVTYTLGSAQDRVRVTSPDGRNRVTVEIRDGALAYSVDRDDRAVLLPSHLGFACQGAHPLRDGLRLVDPSRNAVDETWTQPWGQVARVRDHHNELRVSVAEVASPGRRFVVVFRAFNDGVGFRYELPEQPGLVEFAISDELTEFALADDARACGSPRTVRGSTARRCCSRPLRSVCSTASRHRSRWRRGTAARLSSFTRRIWSITHGCS